MIEEFGSILLPKKREEERKIALVFWDTSSQKMVTDGWVLDMSQNSKLFT